MIEIIQPRGWSWHTLVRPGFGTQQVPGSSFHAHSTKTLTFFYQDGTGTIKIATTRQPWFDAVDTGMRECGRWSADSPREYLDVGRLVGKGGSHGNLFTFLAHDEPDTVPNLFFRTPDDKVRYRYIWKKDPHGFTRKWEDIDVCTARKETHFVAARCESYAEIRGLGAQRLPTLVFVAPDGSLRQVQVSVDPLYRGAINERQVFGSNCVVGSLRDIYPSAVKDQEPELGDLPSCDEKTV